MSISHPFSSAKDGDEEGHILNYFLNRNGGHITPNIYNEYSELKKEYGQDAAEQILRFRLAHIRGLIALAEQEGLLGESQARLVEAFDVFMHPDMYKESLNGLEEFVKQMPGLADGFVATSAPEAIEVLAPVRFEMALCSWLKHLSG